MSRMLEQISRLFVEPEASPARAERASRWLPPGSSGPIAAAPTTCRRVAVVCAPRDARVAGGAAALALTQGQGPEAPVVLEWTGEDPGAAQDRPASLAARRGAALLRDRGEAAVAGGRVVRVGLPGAEDAAAGGVLAALRQAGGPAVLVAAGPRGAAMDDVLAELDRIVLVVRAGADAELSELAVAELERHAPCAVVELSRSPGAAALARSGTALVAPLRGPFLEALGIRR